MCGVWGGKKRDKGEKERGQKCVRKNGVENREREERGEGRNKRKRRERMKKRERGQQSGCFIYKVAGS